MSLVRRGRPRLPGNNTIIDVQLPNAHIERIDALMGPGRRGLFIRSAVEKHLKLVGDMMAQRASRARRAVKEPPPEDQD